jgi:hypothetical protein
LPHWPGDLGSLKPTLCHIKYLIVDEKSMLYFLYARCQEIFPGSADLLFGGLNVILFGDIYQLPPVGQIALYNYSARRTNSMFLDALSTSASIEMLSWISSCVNEEKASSNRSFARL